MNKNSLILIGAGGHCKSCINVIEAEGKFHIKGILDMKEKVGGQILGYPVIGTDDDIADLAKKGHSFLISIGQIKNSDKRSKLYHYLKKINAGLVTIVSPNAVISKYAEIGEGSVIMHGVNINAGVKIGVNCILNTGCTVEHDAQVGNHCHISTHAVLNGGVVADNGVFIGSGAIISNGVHIVSEVVIGAGSLVLKNINQTGIFAGAPVKRIKP